MNFNESISTCLKNYNTFDGRAQRSEYWYFTLALLLASIVIDILDGYLLGDTGTPSLIFGLATILPSLSVSVRRLHDSNRSGLWFLIVLVPIVGVIAFVVMTVLDGTHGPNRFGEDPKGRAPIDPEQDTHSDRIDAP